ncbi:MAG: GH3 auxin-responsive promoter family protein [Bacteroidia bacterium]|nr:GH3 auxin-responsive promoter family protein [Bacteroidia bacterium]
MPIINSIAYWLMKKRMHQIELFMKYPYDVQEEWLRKLVKSAKDTEWGKKFGYDSIENYEQFKSFVPLQDYESMKPFIERTRRGEQNILWATEIKWFAKSAGTTDGKSKFLPVSPESLDGCHYGGGRDMVSIHCNNNPETQLFTGKNLALGGSHQSDFYGDYESFHGDVSAIVIKNLPMWAEYFRAPAVEIALITDWEEKLEKMARSTMEANVTSIAGVPSWMMVLMKRILEYKKVETFREVWPNLEVYFHGGVSFTPYKDQFKKIFDKEDVNYLQLYNASEGFFGIQDQKVSDEMLLMLDYGIYYEFIHEDEIEKENPRVLNLAEIKLGENYEMVISTTAGLWRYRLGDLVRFTNVVPFRFVITGRRKHFINAFGEELMIHNADDALKIACDKTYAFITDYTAGPVFMNDNGENGAHEWIIEFEKLPNNPEFFAAVLDKSLKELNSDYEAKRYNNYILHAPQIRIVPPGTFYNWLKSKNKLGGQNKIPRLYNNRQYLDELIKFLE